jgi:hypothetical protein
MTQRDKERLRLRDGERDPQNKSAFTCVAAGGAPFGQLMGGRGGEGSGNAAGSPPSCLRPRPARGVAAVALHPPLHPHSHTHLNELHGKKQERQVRNHERDATEDHSVTRVSAQQRSAAQQHSRQGAGDNALLQPLFLPPPPPSQRNGEGVQRNSYLMAFCTHVSLSWPARRPSENLHTRDV